MSAETIEWLNENVLVGYTDTNGKAWHATDTAASIENHFAAEVPLERVTDLLGFPVTQEPLQHVGAGGFVASDAHSVIYRPDTGRVFSVMSSGYQIHPYVETLLDGLNGVLANGIGVGGLPGILSIQPTYWQVFGMAMVIAIVIPMVLSSFVYQRKHRMGTLQIV